MTEIIYLDIDGTLRDEQKGIPESAVWAIRQCRELGIKIVICTGRNPGSIQEDVLALPADGLISGGGCYMQYQGENLRKEHFSERELKKVLSLAGSLRLSLAMEAEQRIYMDHHASVFYQEDFQHKINRSSRQRQELIRKQNKIAYEDNLDDLWSDAQGIHKICIFGRRDDVDQAEKELAQETETIQKKKWNQEWYLELLPKGCDKGSAVRDLNGRLGIPKSNSMSFGDSENDIAMMKETGIAVAVGDGSAGIRVYASSVCEAVTEDGIYKELLRRNMIKPFRKGRRA